MERKPGEMSMRPTLPSYSPPASPVNFEGSITPLLARPTPLSRQHSEPTLSTTFSRCDIGDEGGRAWSKLFPGSSMASAIQPMDTSPGKAKWAGEKFRRGRWAKKSIKSPISEKIEKKERGEEEEKKLGESQEERLEFIKDKKEVLPKETLEAGERRGEKRRAWNRVTGLMNTLLQRNEPRRKVTFEGREGEGGESGDGGTRILVWSVLLIIPSTSLSPHKGHDP